jgi:hypothetical protein
MCLITVVGTHISWISSQVKSKLHCDLQSVSQSVSMSWCRAPSGAHDQIFITVWQLRSCSWGVPSLTRGRVCVLYMLLALASAVFLGSESLGTRGNILLSQIWDFPFCRPLRLAGSRWRYWTPPPHGDLEYHIEILFKTECTHSSFRLFVNVATAKFLFMHIAITVSLFFEECCFLRYNTV